MPDPLLVFTTDFGLADSYAGVMKGVALGINPRLRLLDLSHQVPPQNILHGAFVLGTSYRYFPAHAIHVAVVDPGVGTDRRPILLQTPHGAFVAPDNGTLSMVVTEYADAPGAAADSISVPPALRAWHLTNSDYWLQPLSHTFHGRDVFTPVAAHLSLGEPPENLGEPISTLRYRNLPQPQVEADRIRGEVIYVDHFGNLVSSIPGAVIAGRDVVDVRIRGRIIDRLSETFLDGPPSSGLVALLGSHGYLEVAVPQGNAAEALSVRAGEPVSVTLTARQR